MTARELQERYEIERLSPFATKSGESKGRKFLTDKCNIRTEFQKDRDRIIHSTAFRRLARKTQVFISPEGDHYRTRLTHTLEVAQIARTISRALKLNEDLTEAIALGHDLGHTPFGHSGENALNKLLPTGFRHNEQSVRVVEYLEKGGKGLNLTIEVIEGILNHRTACTPTTLEGKVVQISDKIAYITHDIEDAIRAKILGSGDLPSYASDMLDKTSAQRINFLVNNFIEHSKNKADIGLSQDISKIMQELKVYLQDNVYVHPVAHYTEHLKANKMLELMFNHYLEHEHLLPEEFKMRMDDNPTQTVADYIAGMTDLFAINRFREIFIPSAREL